MEYLLCFSFCLFIVCFLSVWMRVMLLLTKDFPIELEVAGHKWISNECCPSSLVCIRTVHSEPDDGINGQPHLRRKQAYIADRLSRTIMNPLVYTPWLWCSWCAFIFSFKSNEETFKGTNNILYNKELRSLKSGYYKYYPNDLKITDQRFDQIIQACGELLNYSKTDEKWGWFACTKPQ